MTNYQQKLHQLDGRQQELVRDNHELKDLCLYLDEERNCIDLSCPHCGEKILSRPNSVVPEDDDPVTSRKFLNHKSKRTKIGFIQILDFGFPLVDALCGFIADSIELEASNSSSNSSGVMSLSSQESDKSKDDHVLDVYQTVMENEGTTDTQKAIVREMCNVVWRVMDKKK